MTKTAKTQWDFGELFPPAATRRTFSVSELTAQIKRLLEKQVGSVWVSGEVSNLRAQSSGHLYFTLKDERAQLNCVLFRGESPAARALVQDGRRVVVQGDLTVYEPRGQYQLIVHAVEGQGVGELQAAFERLKQKLAAEGLFAPERKRPLPRYPQRIGVVTSPTGAALRDVLHVIQRRHPGLELILAPCRVQGEGAAAEIAAAIHLLNEWSQRAPANRLDLLLVTRGGGSLEDLWAFNEEVVARAIFHSHVPVMSAVGHEIDFTISDFVADVRAATPSAAAEMVTEGAVASRQFLAESAKRLRWLVRQRFEREREAVRQLAQRLTRAHPRRQLNDKLQRLDDLQTALGRLVQLRWREQRTAWQSVAERFLRLHPAQRLPLRRQAVADLQHRMFEQARLRLTQIRGRCANAEARLRLLSPVGVLHRGYSLTMDETTGGIIRAAEEVAPGQRLRTRLKQGEVRSIVQDKPGPA